MSEPKNAAQLQQPDPRRTILVLVHPGSACGSANYNLGRTEARAAREGLALELDSWQGGLLVIDGEFSDELDEYPLFAHAIREALERAKSDGLTCERVMGNDPEQQDRIREFIAADSQRASQSHFVVTGAWYHPEDGGGCVGSVIERLKEAGCSVVLADSAVSIEFDEDDDLEVNDEAKDSADKDAQANSNPSVGQQQRNRP